MEGNTSITMCIQQPTSVIRDCGHVEEVIKLILYTVRLFYTLLRENKSSLSLFLSIHDNFNDFCTLIIE